MFLQFCFLYHICCIIKTFFFLSWVFIFESLWPDVLRVHLYVCMFMCVLLRVSFLEGPERWFFS